MNRFKKFSGELALTPGNGAKFFKLEGEYGHSWGGDGSLKIVNLTKIGLLFNLSSIPLLINDKFFV